MKLIRSKVKDEHDKYILIQKLAEAYILIGDGEKTARTSKNKDIQKFSESCKKIHNDIQKLLWEIDKV